MMDDDADGTSRLCLALYGHRGKPAQILGGASAQFLYDAATRLAELEAEVERLKNRIRWALDESQLRENTTECG